MGSSDNSNSAMGKFYEGFMVTGSTTDATDDAVKANIVSVGYKNIPEPDALAGYSRLDGDCSGNNIERTSADTPNHCAMYCETVRGCAGFSFNPSRQVCITKSAACATPTKSNFDFYRRKAGPVSNVETVYAWLPSALS